MLLYSLCFGFRNFTMNSSNFSENSKNELYFPWYFLFIAWPANAYARHGEFIRLWNQTASEIRKMEKDLKQNWKQNWALDAAVLAV